MECPNWVPALWGLTIATVIILLQLLLAPRQDSCEHPALHKEWVSNRGWCVFSKKALPAGTVIAAVAGGKIVRKETARALWRKGYDRTQQIYEFFHWITCNKRDLCLHDFMNHSCDPNVWMIGDKVWVLRRDIAPNEELRWDYATTESDEEYGFRCSCGAAKCRGKVRSDDWKHLDLQVRYYGHFAPYLQIKVEEDLCKNHLAVRGGDLYFTDNYDTLSSHWHRIKGGAEGILVNYRSKFQHIQLILTEKYGTMLTLDGYPQVAERDWRIYHEALGIPPLLLHRNPERVLIGGGGDGALATVICTDPRIKEIVLVDIDPDVVNLCEKYLPFWKMVKNDPRIQIVNDDILRFLAGNRQKFNIVWSDLTDPGEGDLALPVINPEYFEKIQNSLEEEGIFAIQTGEWSACSSKGPETAIRYMTPSFKYIVPYHFHVPSFNTLWSCAIARNIPLPPLNSQESAEILFANNTELISQLKFLNTPERFTAMFALPPKI